MNFMPNEDAFFDEPLHDTVPQLAHFNAPEDLNHGRAPSIPRTDFSDQLLESSLRQEKLMERSISELERMNRRLLVIESTGLNPSVHHSVSTPAPAPSVQNENKSLPARGNLVLPPGSRPATLPNVSEKKPVISTEEENAAREKAEQEAILRRRAEEEARLARIEAERIEREAEEERKRVAELKRIEEEKRMKAELEKKTRGLMTGLLTGVGSGGLFADEELESSGAAKKKGGLFDD
jgi:hypothetical protein